MGSGSGGGPVAAAVQLVSCSGHCRPAAAVGCGGGPIAAVGEKGGQGSWNPAAAVISFTPAKSDAAEPGADDDVGVACAGGNDGFASRPRHWGL